MTIMIADQFTNIALRLNELTGNSQKENKSIPVKFAIYYRNQVNVNESFWLKSFWAKYDVYFTVATKVAEVITFESCEKAAECLFSNMTNELHRRYSSIHPFYDSLEPPIDL